MAELNTVVNVSITRETAAAQQAGFGIAMALGQHKTFVEPFIVVNTTKEVTDAGFSIDSSQYKIASLHFSQDTSPEALYLGRIPSADLSTVTCQASAQASTNYTIVLKDSVGTAETFTYTSAGVETASTVATGLTALINAGTVAITADATAADGTFTLVPDVADSNYSVVVKTHELVSVSTTLVGTLTETLNNLRELSKDWYAVIQESHLEADILEVAAWTEANKSLYGFSTSSASDKTTALTGIGAKLKDLGYDRTFSLYKDEAGEVATVADLYGEAAWLGKQLPKSPGSTNWALQGLNGVDTLNEEGYPEINSTESLNLLSKNMNTYESIKGLGVTRNGTVASGEFIDIIRGIDWFEARLSERLFNVLYNREKLSYTNKDVVAIEAEIYAQFDEAVAVGLADGSVPIEVTIPDVFLANPADRANRAFHGVKFAFRLSGAINYAEIKGTVTV